MDSVRLDKRELAVAVIDAASIVLRDLLKLPPRLGQMQITPIQFTRDELTTVTRISGDISGEVFLGMSRDTARTILRRMLHREVKELGRLEKSALAELGTLVTDTALALLEERGALCYSTWSGVVAGREERVTPFSEPTLAAPLALAGGEVNVNVMFEGYAPFAWASPEARLAARRGLRISSSERSSEEPVPLAA